MAREPGERVQKLLSRSGVASRREAEDWIRAGRLTLNGRAITLGERVTEDAQLRLDGRPLRTGGRTATAQRPVLLCHRSPGLPLLRSVGELEAFVGQLPRRTGQRFTSVSPMPLADGGLELITADGAIATRLQRAVRSLPVEFSLRVRGELSEAQRSGILRGELDRGVRLAVTEIGEGEGAGTNRWHRVLGRGIAGNDMHQLLERQGVSVSRLLRVRLGAVQLDRSLPRGRWRELTSDEIEGLLSPPAEAAGSPATGP
jgi:23S rRNA pseudouridine2605 synthase